MDQNTVGTIAQIGAAIGTIAVAILAIWGDGVRALVAGPNLKLELYDPKGDLTVRQNGCKTYYYHLKVRNERKSSPARSTRIFVVEIQKKSADGTYYYLPHVAPLPLVWTHQRFHEFAPTIGPEDRCDLGHVDQGADRFKLELPYLPTNFDGHLASGESMRVSIKALAHNGEMKKPLVLQISWNGEWDPDSSVMKRNLVIEEV